LYLLIYYYVLYFCRPILNQINFDLGLWKSWK
jgi:hypothetical protein